MVNVTCLMVRLLVRLLDTPELHAWLLGDWLVCGSEVRRGAYRFRNKYQLAVRG